MKRRRLGVFRAGIGVALTTAAALPLALGPAIAQEEPSTSAPTTSSTTTTTTTTTTAAPTSTTTLPELVPTTTPPSVVIPPTTLGPPPTMPDDPPPASLSPDAVASVLDSIARTSPSSTDALLAALRPLLDYGVSPDDVVMMGMGRFPLGGPAYYRDDYGDPRDGPPPHPHGGNDIFAAFDTPVRAPASGTVEFSDSGLGGKAATVTEPDGTYYYMAHLNGFPPGLANGANVTVGQVVGFNGDSGNARGGAPHVHFEIHPNGGPSVNPKPILDQWLADALAAVPALLAPYQQTIQQGGANSRPIIAMGLARHFDRGMLDGPSRLLSKPTVGTPPPADERLADALVDPLTPAVLRS